MAADRFPCANCGAQLVFQPGTTHLKCQYCGFEQDIVPEGDPVVELDIHAFSDKSRLDMEKEVDDVIHCNSCAAEFTVPANEVTKACPFCGSNVVVEAVQESRIKPNGILPFVLNDKRARDEVGKWLGSRFWAPNDLKKMALKEGQLKGMYIPFWTYDAFTETDYSGMRGEYYYVTVTDTDSEGRTRSRQERRTAWYPASGQVEVDFDDLLVLASNAIPEKYGRRLQQWDLSMVAPADKKFLVGFQTMRYSIDLENGFQIAEGMMVPKIDQAIRYDIGGDEQQIHSRDTRYYDVTFKHLLLPVWVGGYRYRGKSFRFLVNGRSGEIQGEAPISFWKVLIAVLLGLIVVGTIAYFYMQSQNSRASSGSSYSNSY